jgi:hypothetical protein
MNPGLVAFCGVIALYLLGLAIVLPRMGDDPPKDDDL